VAHTLMLTTEILSDAAKAMFPSPAFHPLDADRLNGVSDFPVRCMRARSGEVAIPFHAAMVRGSGIWTKWTPWTQWTMGTSVPTGQGEFVVQIVHGVQIVQTVLPCSARAAALKVLANRRLKACW